MVDRRTENILGALALALADELLRAAQHRAPEPGPAAAAIALIGHEPGMTIDRLRRALGLSHSGAVRLVDRLAGEALVVRGASASDRRAVALTLTPSGERGARAILAARQGGLARALAGLCPTERASLDTIMAKLLRALVKDEDHAYAICRLCDPLACTACPVEAELRERA